MKNTFCIKLWTEVYIHNNGDVFSCCNVKPLAYGNIYQDTLRDIINNKIAQMQRQASLSGRLQCYARCHLFDKRCNKPQERPLLIDYNDLQELQILFSEDCNIRCVMCRQKRTGSPVLDYKTLVERVDITPFNSIGIEGGEPLFIDGVRSYVDYAVMQGKKVSFKTNGLLIDEQLAKKIALHSRYLYISLNGATKKTHEAVNRGSEWETVLGNIATVRAYREKYDTPLSLLGHMTIVRENIQEIPMFVRNFRLFGFDKIRFGYDKYTIPMYLMFHPFFKMSLRSKIRKAIRECVDPGAIDNLRLVLLGLL
jgi:MoaA/NifB/PqqE/SkfB family radical SAM enzyme